MGNTRDFFKKIRDTKGTFHAKMSTIKVRNGRDLNEAKILRTGAKNTQKKTTHGHHQMVNTEIILIIIFFAAKDGEALYSQQK